MRNNRAYILVFAVAVLSLTLLPTAVAAMPAELSEYMALLAAGKLYVPYYIAEDSTVDGEKSAEAVVSQPEYSLPDRNVSTEELPADGMIAVQAINLSRYEADEVPSLLLMNETAYKAYPRVAADSVQTIGKGAVLIMHTHGTEAYLPDGAKYYGENEDFRSTDEAETVVAVGEVFADVLRDAGIEVYHDKTMYDAADFENAYTAARNAARKHLAEKPQIRYIIDLHRDAVADKDGNACKTLCRIDGEDSAQVMLVVGTDEAGAAHPNWRDNFCVAAKYQRFLNEYPTLARPIYLRKASYNQQLCTGSMLLEVGSGANTVSEAKTAAGYAARCFVMLYENLC